MHPLTPADTMERERSTAGGGNAVHCKATATSDPGVKAMAAVEDTRDESRKSITDDTVSEDKMGLHMVNKENN